MPAPHVPRRRPDSRGGDCPRVGLEVEGVRSCGRAARSSRHPQGARPRARLSPPVLRRDASARDDRDGARQQPVRAHRGRADDRAGRHGAGADPRAHRARSSASSTSASSSSHTTSGSSRRRRTRSSSCTRAGRWKRDPRAMSSPLRSTRTRGGCSSRCRRSTTGSRPCSRSRAHLPRSSASPRAARSTRAARTRSRRAPWSSPSSARSRTATSIAATCPQT